MIRGLRVSRFFESGAGARIRFLGEIPIFRVIHFQLRILNKFLLSGC